MVPPCRAAHDAGARAGSTMKGDDLEDQGVSCTLPREQRGRLNFQHFMKNHYRVLTAVDENVGRLLDYLDKEGVAENTLLI